MSVHDVQTNSVEKRPRPGAFRGRGRATRSIWNGTPANAIIRTSGTNRLRELVSTTKSGAPAARSQMSTNNYLYTVSALSSLAEDGPSAPRGAATELTWDAEPLPWRDDVHRPRWCASGI